MVKYVAITDIGDFKKGEVVPEEFALVWINMYKVSPIEIVKGEVKVKPKKVVEVNLDLNNDGVVDSKDGKIASKVMNKIRKNKKKKKK